MEKERGRSGLNFLEKASNNSHGYYNYNYGEDQNHNQTKTTSTTQAHSHHSTTSRVGGMVTSTISSSSSSSASSSSSHPHTTATTTTLVVPPPSFNHHHYCNREVGGQDRSLAEKLDLMDTSPIHSRNVTTDEKQVMGGLELTTSDVGAVAVEREHMFDKVVTPSDVGKLNRLVIPKQHAEKYFPLDSSINHKGLLLNFLDASNGITCWRFRYSYWNSSQSYVMTKGWSRFVKDKKLDAGDIVSFQRAKGQLNKERLFFIDWQRRHPPPPPPLAMALASNNFSLHPFYFPGNRSSNNIHYRSSSPMLMGYWRSTTSVVSPPPVLSLPGHAATPLRGRGRGGGGGDHYYHPSSRHTPNFKTTCYNNYYGGIGNPGSNGIYFRSAPVVSPRQQHQASSTTRIMLFPSSSGSDAGVETVDPQQQQEEEEVVLLQSVPVAQGKTAAKRLRLFGVNMDCPISLDEGCEEN